MKSAFQTFDLGSENRVGVDELRHLFCTMGDEFTEEELHFMVKLLDFHNKRKQLYAAPWGVAQSWRQRHVSYDDRSLGGISISVIIAVGSISVIFAVDSAATTC